MNAILRLLVVVGVFAGLSLNAFNAEGIYFTPASVSCDQGCGCDPGEAGQQPKQKCPGISCKQCTVLPAPLIPVDLLVNELVPPQGTFNPLLGSAAAFPEKPIFMIEKPPLI